MKYNETDDFDIVGNIYKSNEHGKFKIIEFIKKDDKNKYYLIEFVETKYQMIARRCNILAGKIRDPYYKSILGIAYVGGIKHPYNKQYKNLYRIWKNILNRCYNIKDPWYQSYGKKGVKVSKEWLCFEQFYNDVIKLEGYEEKLIGKRVIDLDKDYLQQGIDISKKIYSKDTCIWIRKYENRSYCPTSQKYFKAISPEGEEFISNHQSKFAKEHNLNSNAISLCLHNKRNHHQYWRFEYL